MMTSKTSKTATTMKIEVDDDELLSSPVLFCGVIDSLVVGALVGALDSFFAEGESVGAGAVGAAVGDNVGDDVDTHFDAFAESGIIPDMHVQLYSVAPSEVHPLVVAGSQSVAPAVHGFGAGEVGPAVVGCCVGALVVGALEVGALEVGCMVGALEVGVSVGEPGTTVGDVVGADEATHIVMAPLVVASGTSPGKQWHV